MSNRISQIKDKSNSNKKLQFILFGLCSFLALCICMVILVLTANSVEGANSSSAEYDTESKTALSDDSYLLAEYLKSLTEKTVNNEFVKVATYSDPFVEASSIIVSDSANIEDSDCTNLLMYAKDKILPAVYGYYPENFEGEFGSVYNGMPVVDLSNIENLKGEFTVGETDEDGNPLYDSESGEIIDSEYYFLSFFIDADEVYSDEELSALFSRSETKFAKESFIKEISTVCSVRKTEISPESFRIKVKINRFTDKIEYITYDSIYNISSDVLFINELNFLGNKLVSFQYKFSKTYEYDYAGIEFAQSSVTVEPGSEASLSVNAVIEDDSQYTVNFKSSNPSVVTVDEMGYIKGIAESDEPVIITVVLEYLGETFTDECAVTVATADSLGIQGGGDE